MKKLITASALLIPIWVHSQTYNDSISTHRQHYKLEFVTEERSPLKAADTGFLQFFAPDKRYRVNAKFELTPNAQTFDMPTSSGKTKQFRQYGSIGFTINDTLCSLQVFQNMGLLKDPKHKDHLFIPFTDGTTYDETYGGGRYIDLSTNDIKDGLVIVDFNKCYNPYCAYCGSYNCPIPPAENRLKVSVKAGEKKWPKSEH
jgi:uncharacterized protein